LFLRIPDAKPLRTFAGIALIHQTTQILAAIAFARFGGNLGEVLLRDEAFRQRNFLRASDFEALAFFKRADEFAGLEQTFGRACIEPGIPRPIIETRSFPRSR
jgi:hypothetical protein